MENLKIINNFEFERNTEGRNANEYLSYYYPATITVQYKNLVEAIKVRERGGDIGVEVVTDKLQVLIDAGVSIDFSEVKKLYKKELKKELEKDTELKDKAVEEKYRSSWAHDVLNNIKVLKKEGLTAELNCTLEAFQN